MPSKHLKTLKTVVVAVTVLLLGACVAVAQQQVNLAAGPTTATLPDGTVVPMWGFSCGPLVGTSSASCAKLNPNATGWSPVVITVPTGASGGLQINLTNNLTFLNGNSVPTSLVIVGQLGGGLGDKAQRTTTTSPDHTNSQQVTWPIASAGAANTPPAQEARVQSFSTEVAPAGVAPINNQVASGSGLTWGNLRPGTYLIESGTHPSIQVPMGLYGILVVTQAPAPGSAGVAYGTGATAVSYNAELPLLLSEIDPVQNSEVNTAVNTAGFNETNVWAKSGAGIRSITVMNGGSGYSSSPTVTINGAGSGATATATVVGGKITAITVSASGDGYAPASSGGSSTTVTITDLTGTGATAYATVVLGSCGGVANTCYPPAVNYTPLYYLINGVGFNKTNAGSSLFSVTTGTATGTVSGNVLVRLVNAGLRMHVPSIVGSQTGNAPGMSLIAEDGNPLPGIPRVQSEVFMAAGKTYDVMINAPAAGGTALPIFDRQLSLSGNSTTRDAGMLAYISVNGNGAPAFSVPTASPQPDSYNVLSCAQAPCTPLTISDPSKGVIANDTGVFNVRVSTAPTQGTLTLNADGTFVYTPNAGWTAPDSFVYQANGSGPTATVTLNACTSTNNCLEAGTGITVANADYTSKMATHLNIAPPGILSVDTDAAGHPLTVNAASVTYTGFKLSVDPNGGFVADVPGPGVYTFSYKAQNSQGTVSAAGGTNNDGIATVTLHFPTGSGLVVTVLDGVDRTTKITDYRWVIEEDRTFYVDPTCTTNPPPTGCPSSASGIVPTFGTNFHTSYMPLVATGCTGPLSCESGQTVLGQATVCDIGNGVCRTDGSATQQTAVDPGQVQLDPKKRYYITAFPGDAANPFIGGSTSPCVLTGPNASPCGHGMGGAPIGIDPNTKLQQTAVTILTQPSPYPTAKLSVFVFEDDFPLNGEQDGGGGIDVLSPNEPGLGGFNITLFDDAGGTGDSTGQMTYDMFNMPLSNSLAGTMDPATGLDACPIGGSTLSGGHAAALALSAQEQSAGGVKGNLGITGTIVTCPKYESDGTTLSPLAGQAVVANLMPGRYGVVATAGADRIGRGEEWLQTNTLDGQKAHDSFLRIGEPSFFQEFGPAGYHVSIGFANPTIINARQKYVCNNTDPNFAGEHLTCGQTVTGHVSTERMSRTPDERLYGSGDYSSFSFTQCYVSFGDPDGMDFAFTKCDSNGNFTLNNLPTGDWRVTVFDQWNDMLVDGLSTPVRVASANTCNLGNTLRKSCTDLGEIAMNQWQANIYTKTFFDLNGNGIQDDNEDGLALVATNNRFRDGSYSNFNNTDLNGNAGFNEIFPLFSWYVIETDSTRYKSTGTHVVYDAGGPADGNTNCGKSGFPACGASNIAGNMANTAELLPLPNDLRVPGAFYCTAADCTDAAAPFAAGGSGGSTGRIDPPTPFGSYGWQGFSGQNSFVEFGKKPFAPGETGGIHGEVTYASTRPFDDPSLLLHTSWTPNVPGVTINLYQEVAAADGTTALRLIDTTKTSSWDDWAQGFRTDSTGNVLKAADGTSAVPNMNCPGQGTDKSPVNADLFFFTLFNQPMWLDVYANGGTPANTIPYSSQYKCFDGMHNWNQVQPAPYDGYYSFPSVTRTDPASGKWTASNCHMKITAEPWGCVPNNDPSDLFRANTPMLPAGKYVVEMIVPPGYELVKEEDKNILIGDNYIAPVTQQFGGLGSIFILPDQAEVSSLYNSNNSQNPTQTLGRTTYPSKEGDTGSVETFWPCVGAARVVPDYISLFPQSGEVAPFAGATRNLCDRKEVTLTEQTSALAKFWIFTSAHVAAHFTGIITDDFTSEFDPFSPQFGEKFSPPNLPVSLKDWSGTEISRVYTDQWGTYNGLTYSSWEVNPPNPTGYAPTMMVVCMNDPGPILDTRAGSATNGKMIPDPLYNPQYSQFCYEIPFMPGQTQYMDTPVVPTSAFAGAGYNNPDCAYPAATPAVSEVDGQDAPQGGPWVSAAGKTLTIHALGDQLVPNNAYSGPSASTGPYNAKQLTRHYGFGTQCTSPVAGNPNCNTLSRVTIGGVNAPIAANGWSDTSITVTVPNGVPLCAVQQQQQYSKLAGAANTTFCGQLVITAGNGKQSIDSVTVTIGGSTPKYVSGTTPMSPTAVGSIQQAIDAANPGDLIIVPPGTYNEIIQMWKPVRLQGVGAASSVINANTQPAGKMDIWRARVNCLFGLGLNGSPSTFNTSCGSAWHEFRPTSNNPQVDRLPLEAAVGWDATLNGNLAELLQEPSLMGALEGAAITVLAKGVDFSSNPWDSSLAAGFPDGTLLLTNSTSNRSGCGSNNLNSKNPFPSSFWCNPSSIDGLGITDSSQGGGGIYVHGWGHNLQVANNRISSNAGTLSGGINVGQGEFPPAYLGGFAATNAAPGSCQVSFTTNQQLPYCFDMFVNVHNNSITNNSSTGDELFSATPAGAGAVSFCTGSDYYAFDYNWVCGNLSTGDGGGIGQIGFIYHSDPNTPAGAISNGPFGIEGIRHNTVIFNQSTNPTIPANGGGILVMGAPDVDPLCGATTDQDCVPTPGSVGPSDGIGPHLVIDANLIMGNAAEAGSGGGVRLQNVNGTDVITFPTTPSQWWDVTLTNNIITNNVAGWDGAGISLLDALNVNIINNTIMSNDTTASSGVLFNTLGAPLASSSGPACTSNCGTASKPQPAGLVSIQNSAVLSANLPRTITCPDGHYSTANGGRASNGSCRRVSYPELYNDVFFDNRTFFIGVGSLGTGTQNQQNVVTLYNAFGGQTTLNKVASQPSTDATVANGGGTVITGGTGACVTAKYWDIGVRGDTAPNNHSSGVTLSPEASMITPFNGTQLYPGGGTGFRVNSASDPQVMSLYCNGSRVPPEYMSMGYQVPPGISDATVPNPLFNLTPAATVDEGNNWVNISWGPLAMANPVTNAVLGNYSLSSTSTAISYIFPSGANSSPTTYAAAPALDFFGNVRKANDKVDIGAVEFAAIAPPTLTSIAPNAGVRGTQVAVTLTGTNFAAGDGVAVSGTGVTVTGVTVVNPTTITATFTIAANAGLGGHNVSVTLGDFSTSTVTFTVQGPTLTSITPTSHSRAGNPSFTVTLRGTNLQTTVAGPTNVTVSGTGVTVSNVTVVNATTVTATFTISSTASTTFRNVAVVTPIGTTNNVTFRVTP